MRAALLALTLALMTVPAFAEDAVNHDIHAGVHSDGAEVGWHITLPEGVTWSARVNSIDVTGLPEAVAAVEMVQEHPDTWTGDVSIGYNKNFSDVSVSVSAMLTYGEHTRELVPGVEVRLMRDRWIAFANYRVEDDDIAAVYSRHWRGVRAGIGLSF